MYNAVLCGALQTPEAHSSKTCEYCSLCPSTGELGRVEGRAEGGVGLTGPVLEGEAGAGDEEQDGQGSGVHLGPGSRAGQREREAQVLTQRLGLPGTNRHPLW